MGEDGPEGTTGGENGPSANPTKDSWMAQSAKRYARHQTMKPMRIKHGLLSSPTIKHSQDGTGTSPPRFGIGGGFKSAGF